MADFSDIVTAVVGDPALQTLMGGRIYPVVLPADPDTFELPAVTYGLATQPTDFTQTPDFYRSPRWRFRVWSLRYRDLQPIAVALAALFSDPVQSPFGRSWVEYPQSNAEGHEKETNRYWRALDVVANSLPAGAISQ